MDVSLLSKNDLLVYSCEAIQLQHNEAAHTLYAEIPGGIEINDGDAIGFYDIDNNYLIFEITTRTLRQPDNIWALDCINKGIFELMGEPIEEKRARNSNVNDFVERLLENTRFDLVSTASGTGTMTAYYESVWSALVKVQETYGVRCLPYYTITDGLVTGRHLGVKPAGTVNRGRIFELGDDLTGLDIQYDDSNVKTALYGRGQGIEIDSGDSSTDPAYGRRLTFADAVWDTDEGDPADKPEGQEWIGDPAALALFGRDGRHRYGFAVFDNVTDAGVLLQKTWETLQDQNKPIISITGTVRDTERIFGRSHEAVRMYDTVLVRLSRSGQFLDISAIVREIVRDYVYPDSTKITIGNTLITSGDVIRDLSGKMASYDARSAVWDRANAFDLQGAMDVMNNQIMSTTGHWYTDPDTGAIMMVSADGTKAMRLTGAGWQISNTKVSGAWQWTTAATGDGIVASTITAGYLSADRISAHSLSFGKLATSGVFSSVDENGLTVTHTEAGNAYTTLDANGIRIFNSSNALIGGLYVPTGQQDVKMGATTLMNPAYPNFSAQLDRLQPDPSLPYRYMLSFYRQNTFAFGLGMEDDPNFETGFLVGKEGNAAAIDFIIDVAKNWHGYEPNSYRPIASMVEIDSGLKLWQEYGEVYLNSPGDIYLIMHVNGNTLTLRMSDVYDILHP